MVLYLIPGHKKKVAHWTTFNLIVLGVITLIPLPYQIIV